MYYTYHTYYMYYTVRIALPRNAAACSLHGAIHSAAAAGCGLLSSLQAARCWCDCCYCRLLRLQQPAGCGLLQAASCRLQAAGCCRSDFTDHTMGGVCVCVRTARRHMTIEPFKAKIYENTSKSTPPKIRIRFSQLSPHGDGLPTCPPVAVDPSVQSIRFIIHKRKQGPKQRTTTEKQ